MRNLFKTAVVCGALGLSAAGAASAAGGHAIRSDAGDRVTLRPGSPELKLDLSRGVQEDIAAAERAAQDGAATPQEAVAAGEGAEEPRERRFGRSGSQWLTFGAGYANDLESDSDYNVHAAWSRFIADELEFAVEVGGWYFDQRGDNTGGINGNLVLRWHALHDDNFDWTLYTDVGMGLLAGFDLVPDGGTGFNFTPRAGVGFTRRLGDSATRLQVGLRYHHVSNGRIEGDERNPARDSVMVYAGIIIPW